MTEHPYKIGYKVLTKTRMSVISTFHDSDLRVHAKEYKIFRRITRQMGCGPLAVFNTLSNANKFMGVNCRVSLIVPCAYKPYTDCLQAFWIDTTDLRFTYLPTGTMLAEEVICLE